MKLLLFFLIIFPAFSQDKPWEDAAKITYLQDGYTSWFDERKIAKIFKKYQGKNLSKLKLYIDLGGDDRDMETLLNSDIDYARYRRKIHSHIREQAGMYRSNEYKVLSDLDDTLKASLNDYRIPEDTLYPGVREFYAELDKVHPQSDPIIGDLIFISARPQIMENITHSSLREMGILRASIMCGSIRNLLSHTRMADMKFESFKKMASYYPEYDYIWIGDSGQGDALFGRRILKHYPQKTKAVFIHDIGNMHELTPSEQRIYQTPNLHLFQTYVGAALIALKEGLLSPEAAQRISAAAIQQARRISFESEFQRIKYMRLLEDDREALENFLKL